MKTMLAIGLLLLGANTAAWAVYEDVAPKEEQPFTTTVVEASQPLVKDCQFLGAVKGKSGWGGMAASLGVEQSKEEALKAAEKLGATHIVWTTVVSAWGAHVTGDAYKCQSPSANQAMGAKEMKQRLQMLIGQPVQTAVKLWGMPDQQKEVLGMTVVVWETGHAVDAYCKINLALDKNLVIINGDFNEGSGLGGPCDQYFKKPWFEEQKTARPTAEQKADKVAAKPIAEKKADKETAKPKAKKKANCEAVGNNVSITFGDCSSD